jgi:hypothetical protein
MKLVCRYEPGIIKRENEASMSKESKECELLLEKRETKSEEDAKAKAAQDHL